MYNYNKNLNNDEEFIKELQKSFFIVTELTGGGDEWLTAGMPVPTLFCKTNWGGYLIYALEGFFATEEGLKFVKDIKERIKITLIEQGAKEVRILNFKPDISKFINLTIYKKIYNLRDELAPTLKSLPTKSQKSKIVEYLSEYVDGRETEDALFDAIRFTVYDFVKANSKNALSFEYVMEIALNKYKIVGNKKGESTARAKAKAIFNWVKEHYNPGGNGVWNWNYVRKTKSEEELKMTRRQRALENNKKRYDEAHKKILSLTTGMFKQEYVKKDGSFNISKIAKDTGYSRNTIYKHFKDAGLI